MSKETDAHNWLYKGRCYKLGHDVPHPGGVVPNLIIIGRHFDAADIIPRLFEETDPGFHTRCRPGDIIVAGQVGGTGYDGNPTSGSSDVFVARFTRSGRQLWVKQFGSIDDDLANEPHELQRVVDVTRALKPLFGRASKPLIIINAGGFTPILRPNHLVAPTNNPKVRQAMLYAMNQSDSLAAMVGNKSLEKECWAVFACGFPLETTSVAVLPLSIRSPCCGFWLTTKPAATFWSGEFVSLARRPASATFCAATTSASSKPCMTSRASSASDSPAHTLATSRPASARRWPHCQRSAGMSTFRCNPDPHECSSACGAARAPARS
mgnify:CR=1 FL=1